MQGIEDTDLNTLPACPLQHGAGGAAEQAVEQGPVVAEEGPQQVGHVMPFAIGKDVLLLRYPLLYGLHVTGAVGL